MELFIRNTYTRTSELDLYNFDVWTTLFSKNWANYCQVHTLQSKTSKLSLNLVIFSQNLQNFVYPKETLPHIHSHFSQGTLFIWNDFWLHVYQEILSVHRLKDKIHIGRPSWTYFRGLLPCAVSTRKRYKFPDYTHRIWLLYACWLYEFLM